MWRFWDEFGIRDAEWLGYWNPKCPVKTDDASVLATAYCKPGKALVALAHWPAERGRAGAVAHEASAAPSIDGRLAPGEWDQAAQLTGFTLHDGDRPAPDQTEAFVTWDRERLYVAFRCAQPGGNPKADVRRRDGNVWEDDAVELFLQPDPEAPTYTQFIGNSAGTIFDGQGLANVGWNGDWVYRASVAGDSWVGELSIPLASLGLKPGTGDLTLGLNLCRDQQLPTARASCWSPVSGSFHNTESFGRLTLSATRPSTRQEVAGKPGSGTLNVRLRVDWKAVGLDPARAKLTAPFIEQFQPSAEFTPAQPIPIEPGKGWLLLLHE
jgi:hypothetical protein